MLCVTHNRADIVGWAIHDNFATLDGAPIREIVWLDNGSTDAAYQQMRAMFYEVATLHSVRLIECRLNVNRGAAWAQNRAIALASGDAFLVTDCDMTFNPGVLRDAAEVLFRDERRMSVSIYHFVPDPAKTPERFTAKDNVSEWGPEWSEQLSNGHTVRLKPGLAMVSKMFRREAVEIAGWIHQGFGLCEYDDCEWAYRLRARCCERGLMSLVMMGTNSTHLPDVLGGHPIDTEGAEYWDAKEREFKDPNKVTTMLDLAARGWPRFDPYPSSP